MSRRAAPSVAQRPAAIIDYAYAANPDFLPRRVRHAAFASLRKTMQDEKATAETELLAFVLSFLPHLMLEGHDEAKIAECFQALASVYVHRPSPSHENPAVVVPSRLDGKRKAFLPHPALPVVLECDVQRVYTYDYHQEPDDPLYQAMMPAHASLQEFQNCHRVPFVPTPVEDVYREPFRNQPGAAARRRHTEVWTIAPTEEGDTHVRQTVVCLKATHIHWRLDDDEDPRDVSEPDVYTVSGRYSLQDPTRMSRRQILERTRQRNALDEQGTYDKPPMSLKDDPQAKHHSMVYTHTGPLTAHQPPWTTAPIQSPAFKEEGTPLLPHTFTIQGRTLPLPALFDDLLFDNAPLQFVAHARQFVDQHILFAQNLKTPLQQSIVDNDHTHLFNPLTGTEIPITELPATDTTGILDGRQRRDRFCDICLQPTRYLRPDPM